MREQNIILSKILCQSVNTLYTFCSKWSYKNSKKKLIQNDVYLLICDVNFYKVFFILIVFTLETTKINSGFIICALFSYETKFGLPSNSICIFHQKVHSPITSTCRPCRRTTSGSIYHPFNVKLSSTLWMKTLQHHLGSY